MENKETYWSRFADDFEEKNYYVVGKEDMMLLLDETAKQKQLKNTLELACGNGTYTKVLAANSELVVATDFSEEMLHSTKKRLSNFKNVKFEQANAFNLQFEANAFDTVFAANLLHVVPTPEDIIKECKRVLKSTGRIIILDLGIEGITFINKIKMIYRYLKTYGKPPKKGKKLTVSLVVKMLEEEGFNIKEAKLTGNQIKAAFVVAINN